MADTGRDDIIFLLRVIVPAGLLTFTLICMIIATIRFRLKSKPKNNGLKLDKNVAYGHHSGAEIWQNVASAEDSTSLGEVNEENAETEMSVGIDFETSEPYVLCDYP